MKIFNYLFKDLKTITYFLTALCISFITGIVMNLNLYGFYKLFFPVFFILFILRTNDDIYDYEKDKDHKIQYLSKKQLIVLNIICSLLFLAANTLIYKTKGLYSVFVLMYIFFLEKSVILKIIFGACLFAFFAVLNSVASVTTYIIGTSVFITVSYMFYFKKKRKNHDL